jgi:hypothetical protein
MIIINWDWASFVAGVFAVLTVQFWLVVFVAFRQWKKGKQVAKDSDAIFAKWMQDGKL